MCCEYFHQQLNQLCLWSTAEIEGGDTAMSMENSLPEEPQLISAVEHEGSVTDIKVDNMLLYFLRSCVRNMPAYIVLMTSAAILTTLEFQVMPLLNF